MSSGQPSVWGTLKRSSFVLRGATLVTMDAGRRIVEGDLWVQDGVIAGVGGAQGAGQDAEVVDASGHVVLPGFVQGHVHLGQSLFRGLAEGRPLMPWLRERVWPLEAALDERSTYWSGMLGAADCLLGGTTTIHEIGVVRSMDAIMEAIVDSGIRAVAGKCLMDQGDGVPAVLLEPVEEAIDEVRRLHNRWDGAHGRISTALCPRFILSCSDTLWEAVAELAEEWSVGVHTHLLEHPDEGREIQAAVGMTELQYFDRLGLLDADLRIAHGVQLTAEHLEALEGRTLRVCHCPSANLKLGSGIADLGLWARSPAIVAGIGCDGAPCNNDMDALEEIRLCALLQQYVQTPGAFSAEDALALATCEGAEAIGLGSQVGSLEVGKAADLTVWALEGPQCFAASPVSVYDRLVYGTTRQCLEAVFVDGVVRVANGQLQGPDPEALRRCPQEAIAEVLARASLPGLS